MTRLLPSVFAHAVDAVLIGSFLFACGVFVH